LNPSAVAQRNSCKEIGEKLGKTPNLGKAFLVVTTTQHKIVVNKFFEESFTFYAYEMNVLSKEQDF
jgi:hypothetical protein